MQSEAGECGNFVKKIERQNAGLVGSKATTSDVAKEMADTIIYMDLLAARLHIDLERAIVDKFNETSEKYGFEERL